MSAVKLKRIITLLKEFTRTKKSKLEIILVGGLAVQYFGLKNRPTIDIDAEVKGDLEGLLNFFKAKNIPADFGENVSRWSIISLPEGYRKRAITISKNKLLTVKALAPIDFIISKIGRFTETDLEDALFVVKRFNIQPQEIQKSANSAIRTSPKDTALFIFKKNVELFIKKVSTQQEKI